MKKKKKKKMMMMMMMMHQHDYDRDETQCMLVDRYASQRFSSQNNSWIVPEPTILQMRLHDVACSMQAHVQLKVKKKVARVFNTKILGIYRS